MERGKEKIMGSRGASSQVNKRMNIDRLIEDTAKINPNYSTGKKEYRVNCQACALAFILREQGEDVVALPRTGWGWEDNKGKRIYLTDMFNNNPQKFYYVVGQRRFDDEVRARTYANGTNYNLYKVRATEKSIFMGTADAIENEVKKWGNGASGFVHVDWKGSSGSHVFNIKNIKGQVVAIDSQSGSMRSLRGTLSRAKPQFTYITRTDNLKVKKDLKKYFVKGA